MVVVLLSRGELPGPFGREESISPGRSAVRGPGRPWRDAWRYLGPAGPGVPRPGKDRQCPLIAVAYGATANTAFPISSPPGGLADVKVATGEPPRGTNAM